MTFFYQGLIGILSVGFESCEAYFSREAKFSLFDSQR
jgi:hypothetical protein